MKSKKFRIILYIVIAAIALSFIVIPRVWNSSDDSGSINAPIQPAANATNSGGGASSRSLGVTVATVRSEMVLDGIRSIGTLRPMEQVDISAEIAGKVQEVLFKEGQAVTKGQSLIKINDDDLQAQLTRYQFQEKTLAERLERQRILLQREAISQETFDAVQTDYNVLNADIALLNVRIDRSTVKAPFAGVIGFRYVSEGTYIQPGTKIAQLVDFSQLRVEFAIPEKYISLPLIGQKIYFTTEGNDRRNEARIYAMEPKIDEATRTIVVRALFDNAAGRIRPGMTARITIPTAAESTRLLIPSQSVVPTMEGKTVWLVENGRATQRIVTTGIRLERDVEVLSGLNAGDSIIINGIMQASEGIAVKVIE